MDRRLFLFYHPTPPQVENQIVTGLLTVCGITIALVLTLVGLMRAERSIPNETVDVIVS